MKAAIIGATSLLASYITEKLRSDERNEVWLFGRHADIGKTYPNQKFQYFSYPDTVPDFSVFLAFYIIIYCAATGVQAGHAVDTDLIYEVNAFLPIKLLNYLSDNDFSGKWVSFGSYFEIGNNTLEHAFSEEEVVASTLAVPNHYCASKRLLTRFINAGIFTISAYHFILPTIYGAKENVSRLIPYIVNALQQQHSFQLSAGAQVRQYIHCQDVVDLIYLLQVSDYNSGIYNVASEGPIQIADLVRHVFSYFNQNCNYYLGTLNTRDESMKYLVLNNSKIMTQIPEWKPMIKIHEGIREYL